MPPQTVVIPEGQAFTSGALDSQLSFTAEGE